MAVLYEGKKIEMNDTKYTMNGKSYVMQVLFFRVLCVVNDCHHLKILLVARRLTLYANYSPFLGRGGD